MLEFIVLGNVPGTHLNITFSWILAFAAIFLIVLEVRYHKNYALKVQTAAASAGAVSKTKRAAKKPAAQSQAKKKTTKKK